MRSTAPAAQHPALDAGWYRENGFLEIPETGPHAVTVPGAVKAWETLLGRFGTRGFDALFADAIRYAEDGFAVHQRVAWDWPRYVQDLAQNEGGARHCLVDGRAPREGERFRFPALAATLRTIASGGAKAFYEGEIAAGIVATVQGLGGFLGEDDLAAVSADWVDPEGADYRGVRLLEIPPNGQGITALIQLAILDRIAPSDTAPLSAGRLHALIESGRLAYSVRDHLVADPSAMAVPVETLLSPAFAAELASRFDPARRNEDLALPKMPASSTIYLTVADHDGRIVSFINSLYGGFGSKVVAPRSGIVLQNRGACFTLAEGHPNEIGPGKRPMHTIIPAMVLKDGRPWMSYGVMGGDYQPMGHVHVLSNMVDHGMDPQEAVDHPRIFWGEDGVLDAESGLPDDAVGGSGGARPPNEARGPSPWRHADDRDRSGEWILRRRVRSAQGRLRDGLVRDLGIRHPLLSPSNRSCAALPRSAASAPKARRVFRCPCCVPPLPARCLAAPPAETA